MTSILTPFLSSLFRWPDPREIEASASPGLITLLDVALYRSNEGGLTGTVCAANVVLDTFLELKKYSRELLHLVLLMGGDGDDLAESFARLCIECSSGAIEKLTTEKLAISANLPVDPGVPSGMTQSSSTATPSSSSGTTMGATEGVLESARTMDNGRPKRQRRENCWESLGLHCPDYVYADEAFTYCHKIIRAITKHRFFSNTVSLPHAATALSPADPLSHSPRTRPALPFGLQKLTDRLYALVRDEIPIRLHQFRAALDADGAVSKRLYLVKCEYRAPFRAFLEAHNTVQRAPRIEMVEGYLSSFRERDGVSASREEMKKRAERRLQGALENPELAEGLRMEQRCEMLEVGMARILLPFCELARFMDGKKMRCLPVKGVLEAKHVPAMRELVRRLKSLLTKKAGSETSVGIRPVLLDLQGVPRDNTCRTKEIHPFHETPDHNLPPEQAILIRLQSLTSQLTTLLTICKDSHKNRGLQLENHKKDLEIPSALLRSCSLSLDAELFIAQYRDWYALVRRQTDLKLNTDNKSQTFEQLAETMRQSEIEVSIAMASEPSLIKFRLRLENHEKDRLKRFAVLQDIVREVCSREMDLRLVLTPPDKHVVLELPEIKSALGLFGPRLLMAGEVLPL